MADVVTVQLRFGVDTVLGLYQDTLSFTEAEWAKRDPVAIEAAKQALADTWVTFYSAQIVESAALQTQAGKQAKIADIDAKIDALVVAKDSIQSALDALK